MDINIKWIKREFTIEKLVEGITDGVIDLHPSVQRNDNVWPEKMQAAYIKTLTVCNIPFAIYAYSDGRKKVNRLIKHIWDGLQRSSIVYKYVTNTLDCKSLKVTPFKDLRPEIQQKILNISVTMMDAGDCDEETIAMLFTTMNTNGCPLNDQEIRDSAYRGAFTKTVAAISDRHRSALGNIFTAAKANRKIDRKFLITLFFIAKNDRHMENSKGIDDFVKTYDNGIDQAIIDRIEASLRYYNSLKLPSKSMWKRMSHAYTLLVEIYKSQELPAAEVMREKLIEFETNLQAQELSEVFAEYKALCIHHLNSASNRGRRQEILSAFLKGEIAPQEAEQVTA